MTYMHWRVVVSTIVALGLGTGVASAGPWTPAKGHGQVIFGWTLYRTGEEFSASRDRESFGNEGVFSKNEINPYFETGLTDRLAFVGSFFASDQGYRNSFGHLDNHGLGDTELGLRYRMTGTDRPVIVAFQGSTKLATGKSDGAIALTNGQTDVEGRVLLGGSFGRSERPPFWNVDTGYRFRAGDPADELRVDATIGAYLSRRVMVVGQADTITGMRNADPRARELNPTLTPDYDLYRMQGSVVVRVASRVRAQAGGFFHAWGRSTGAGGGVIAALWLEY
jgi:hypothetical protein